MNFEVFFAYVLRFPCFPQLLQVFETAILQALQSVKGLKTAHGSPMCLSWSTAAV